MATMPLNNRILIVEDDPTVRRLMTSHFRREGFQVEYAVSAEEVAADEPYDVILTDVHLPGESGLDLARRIHRAQPQQPVVFVTGDSDARLAGAAIDVGAAGYLLKPFELFELDAAVHGALRSRAPKRLPYVHITRPAKFVLAPRTPQRSLLRRLRDRLRVGATVVAMLVVAWGVGAAIDPAPVEPVVKESAVREDGATQVMVPVVIDKTVYLNR